MSGIGHELPLPLHVLGNGADGPARERDDQREHQQPADRTEKERQQRNAHHCIPPDGTVQEDNAVSAIRTGKNLISERSRGSGGLFDIEPERQLGGLLLRDGSNVAHVCTEYPALRIQIRNKVQCGHAHVVVHRLVQEAAAPPSFEGFRLTAARRRTKTRRRIRSCGCGRLDGAVFRTREKSPLPSQIIQKKFRLAGIGNRVEHIQCAQHNQQQDTHGNHRRDDKLLLQRPDHFGTSSV